ELLRTFVFLRPLGLRLILSSFICQFLQFVRLNQLSQSVTFSIYVCTSHDLTCKFIRQVLQCKPLRTLN
ncbi:hypothetical protein PTB13_27120, partial [Bacillus sp. MHSD17]|nr:hypothetical protein [Bacillus sp. MHSD17]